MLLEGRGESIHIIIGTYTDMNESWDLGALMRPKC